MAVKSSQTLTFLPKGGATRVLIISIAPAFTRAANRAVFYGHYSLVRVTFFELIIPLCLLLCSQRFVCLFLLLLLLFCLFGFFLFVFAREASSVVSENTIFSLFFFFLFLFSVFLAFFFHCCCCCFILFQFFLEVSFMV